MTNQEAMRIAQGLITDFKCESETMVEFCNVVIKALKQQDRIIQILDDYNLEAWEILEKIKEVVKE